MFNASKWTVKSHCGTEYEAIGTETRGLWGVPVADYIDGQYIQCEVYEIIHGMIKNPDGLHISITRPNPIELRLLKDSGWNYNGCFATKGV